MNRKLLLLMLLMPLSGIADEASIKGLQIAQETDRRNTGWQSSTANMKMVLKNAKGKESTRAISVKTLEVSGDGDKSLTTFRSPRDVKGTSFLSYSHALVPDEQWLYLPSLKRVKRISSANKSGPFMGSEFAFEDLASFEVEKYTYRYVHDDVINNVECFVLEMIPSYKHSGYSKQTVWIDKQEYRVLKTDFYDRKGSLLKTLKYRKYNVYLHQYWRADEMEMFNHQTRKSTVLFWQDYKFGTQLSHMDFSKNSLQRAR